MECPCDKCTATRIRRNLAAKMDAMKDRERALAMERLGANFIAIGLAARLAMATFEITKAAYPKLDGFFAAAETARLLRAMAGIDPEDHRVEKAGAP